MQKLNYQPLNAKVEIRDLWRMARKTRFDGTDFTTRITVALILFASSLYFVGVVFVRPDFWPVLFISLLFFFLAMIGLWGLLTGYSHRIRVKRFAQKNKLDYIDSTYPLDIGVLSDQGLKESRHFVEGVKQNRPSWMMATYCYYVGRTPFFYGILMAELPKKVPHILIDGQAIALEVGIDPQQEYQLEGNFSDYFKLYVLKGSERDVLYFMTPELMAYLVDNARNFTIEIIDGKLIIYRAGGFDFQEQEISRLLAFTQDLIGEFSDNTQHYSFVAHKSQLKKEPFFSLRNIVSFGIIVVFLVLLGIVVFNMTIGVPD